MNAGLSLWLAADAIPTFGLLRRDAGSIQELARTRLSRLLFHVARQNEFYGRRLQAAGIEWADPLIQRDPYAVLALLPPVSKPALRRAGRRVLDSGELRPEWYSSTSSGSTGEPFRVYYDPRSWGRLKYLIKLRARRACGVRPTDRIALLEATSPSDQRATAGWLSRWTRISILQPTHKIAAALDAFAPDALYGVPSTLADVGRILQQEGRRPPVKRVFTSGELLHSHARLTLSTTFQAPVYDIYGTAETKEIAWECNHGNMHVNADVVHLEAVDDEGRGLPHGQEGDLVATLLVNRAMPLIRYHTGDRGTLLAGSCACGCALPRLGVVTRRTADIEFADRLPTGPRARFRVVESLPAGEIA